MTRRAILAGGLALAALAVAGPVLAQTATLALPDKDLAKVKQAAAYLQTLKEVEGRFEQTSPRGVVSTGELYLKRPGKARFQYDPPSGLLVVSDGRNVSVWDGRLRTFQRAPLGATPLAILLSAHVRFDEDVEVFKVGDYEDGFYLSARSPDANTRTQGYITMVFSGSPLALRGWTLVDGQGQATKVKISSLTTTTIKPEMFVLTDPRSPEERVSHGKVARP